MQLCTILKICPKFFDMEFWGWFGFDSKKLWFVYHCSYIIIAISFINKFCWIRGSMTGEIKAKGIGVIDWLLWGKWISKS